MVVELLYNWKFVSAVIEIWEGGYFIDCQKITSFEKEGENVMELGKLES